MVASDPSPGLIAAVQVAATPTLDDVAASCGWPVLLQATPRRIQRELATTNPSACSSGLRTPWRSRRRRG